MSLHLRLSFTFTKKCLRGYKTYSLVTNSLFSGKAKDFMPAYLN